VGERDLATWSIGELAEQTGVTPRTVRYYVAEGLLPAPGGTGQQRTYTAEHLRRLRAIKRLKEAYLPLEEIRRRLAALPPEEVERLAEAPPTREPGSALDYLATVLVSASAPMPQGVGEVNANAGNHRALIAYEPASVQKEVREATPPASPYMVASPGSAPATTWRRVVVGPGVELHYQPGDASREAAIARVARQATEALAAVPTPDYHLNEG